MISGYVDRLWNDKDYYSKIKSGDGEEVYVDNFWLMLEVVGSMCTIPPSVVETRKVMEK